MWTAADHWVDHYAGPADQFQLKHGDQSGWPVHSVQRQIHPPHQWILQDLRIFQVKAELGRLKGLYHQIWNIIL